MGPEFRVSTSPTTVGGAPAVARDGTIPGDFVVVWNGYDGSTPPLGGVLAQRFDNAPFPTSAFFLANAPRAGSELVVDAYSTGSQFSPRVAMHEDGRFLIVWDSFLQDGDQGGIYGRRFNFPAAAAMHVDETPSGGTSDVNGVLDPGERVVVAPSWTDNRLAPLPLHGSASNLTGPPGPSYSIEDADAAYGIIDPFQTRDCEPTGNCYEMTVSGSRPAPHWDATFDETLGSEGPLGPEGANQPVTKTWRLHVGGSFPDVPQDAFYPFVENIFHNGITAGGACGPGNFCGEEEVLRQQMAVFLLKSSHGAAFVPPPATGAVFDDVPASSPFAPWIEELAAENIPGGCIAPPPPALPSFCPGSPVTRQQMAVFLIKTLYGPTYSPPGCAGIFEDVPCPGAFTRYVEFLFTSQIAAGCSASPPLFCPTDPTRRKQMAAFLVRTFDLHLYGRD